MARVCAQRAELGFTGRYRIHRICCLEGLVCKHIQLETFIYFSQHLPRTQSHTWTCLANQDKRMSVYRTCTSNTRRMGVDLDSNNAPIHIPHTLTYISRRRETTMPKVKPTKGSTRFIFNFQRTISLIRALLGPKVCTGLTGCNCCLGMLNCEIGPE